MAVVELPLFPLNTVLFPGMPLQLHIFEDRYKQLIDICIRQSIPFGVALIRSGREANGPLAEPFDVGCTARIADVQYLAEGRMNIAAIGQERFRIITLDRGKESYLTGVLDSFPLDDSDPDAAATKSRQLIPLYVRYLQILSTVGKADLEMPEMPAEPTALGYLAAITLQVTNHDKQQFLDSKCTADFLSMLCDAYRREITILRSVENRKPPAEAGRFSVN